MEGMNTALICAMLVLGTLVVGYVTRRFQATDTTATKLERTVSELREREDKCQSDLSGVKLQLFEVRAQNADQERRLKQQAAEIERLRRESDERRPPR